MRSGPPFRPPTDSGAAIRPSGRFRRSGSRSTMSSTPGSRASLRLGAAPRRRAVWGDLVPVARGPPREAIPARPRARLHLSAGAPGVSLRGRARGRADHAPRPLRHPRGDRAKPPLELCPPSRRAQGDQGCRCRRRSWDHLMAARAADRRPVPPPRPRRRVRARSPHPSQHHARAAPAPKLAQGRRPARVERRPALPMPVRLVPVAVGRTAVAVSGIAESGLVRRLTRGRLWIGLLTTLLVGIVALNVLALSFNATASKSGRQVDTLKREISHPQGARSPRTGPRGNTSRPRPRASASSFPSPGRSHISTRRRTTRPKRPGGLPRVRSQTRAMRAVPRRPRRRSPPVARRPLRAGQWRRR